MKTSVDLPRVKITTFQSVGQFLADLMINLQQEPTYRSITAYTKEMSLLSAFANDTFNHLTRAINMYSFSDTIVSLKELDSKINSTDEVYSKYRNIYETIDSSLRITNPNDDCYMLIGSIVQSLNKLFKTIDLNSLNIEEIRSLEAEINQEVIGENKEIALLHASLDKKDIELKNASEEIKTFKLKIAEQESINKNEEKQHYNLLEEKQSKIDELLDQNADLNAKLCNLMEQHEKEIDSWQEFEIEKLNDLNKLQEIIDNNEDFHQKYNTLLAENKFLGEEQKQLEMRLKDSQQELDESTSNLINFEAEQLAKRRKLEDEIDRLQNEMTDRLNRNEEIKKLKDEKIDFLNIVVKGIEIEFSRKAQENANIKQKISSIVDSYNELVLTPIEPEESSVGALADLNSSAIKECLGQIANIMEEWHQDI